ncbi:malonate decarboxylase holo-[acyl-carrier-protein] synthase [Herminiimonas arsenitoxidans]|uniref:malonate decarboxylase holo-[acyl-carrier-protein] synthase n=1 Tax=Herminiimonas arsenitoxidans TaxID=1809410 RepID=UPI000970782D|nr:malonate decarboxylase holo-[acyl-carrier-protein] synthase [Herminiimonas arsenitoxidans]
MFYRHNRIWLTARGWEGVSATVALAHAQELARWADHNWPLIVRRSEYNLLPNTIGLGLALPPDPHTGVKTRIPLSVDLDDIARHEAPLALAAAKSALPLVWQAAFSELSDEACNRQLEFRVYGSLALQAVTGLPYLTAASDIDVLFYPHTHAQLQQGLDLLCSYAKQLPLDGEIVFPSGRAVAWKEWVDAIDHPHNVRVLAKSMSVLNLIDLASLLSELEELS